MSLDPKILTNENHIYFQKINFKDNNYFRKSFGSAGDIKKDDRKNKLIEKPPIGEQKKVVFNKVFALKREYYFGLRKILDEFIERAGDILEENAAALVKAKDPERQLKYIDNLMRDAIVKTNLLINKIISSAYDFGSERAQIETGITIGKSSVDFDSLNFLDNHNINLIEGAFSEVSARVKTQIRLGIQAQESIPQIVRRIKGDGSVFEVYKGRIQNIARTEVNRAMSEGHLNGYEQSGVIKKVEALIGTDPDGKCHELLQGKVFTIEESHGLIPVHQNCSCGWLPIIEGIQKAKI